MARHGAIAGILAAAVMALVSMVLDPVVSHSLGFWSFPKLVSSILLGDVGNPASFTMGPVLLGLALHLVIGAMLGVVLSMLIAQFDIEEPAPVLLVGLVFSAVAYAFLWTAIGQQAFPHLGDEPVLVPVLSHMAFGITLGSAFASWTQRFDIDAGDAEADPSIDASTTRRRGPAADMTLHH